MGIIPHKRSFSRLLILVSCWMCSFCPENSTAQQKSSQIKIQDGKKFFIHKIEKKQSVYSIARLYAVSLEEIYAANPGLMSGARAGQEIMVPFTSTLSALITEQPDTSKYQIYKVTKGETMYSVMQK